MDSTNAKDGKRQKKKRKKATSEDQMTAQHTVKVREHSKYSMQIVAVGEAGIAGMGGVRKQCNGKTFLHKLSRLY